MMKLKLDTFRRGLLIGAAAGIVLAAGFTFADWLSNPGGIFRGDNGTRWGIVWETFLSWFWPLLLFCLGVAFAFSWFRSRK